MIPLAIFSPSPDLSMQLGRALGARWAADSTLSPLLVVALNGQLGTGKTHFAKGIVAGLGGDPMDVTSPTFTLQNIYDTPAARVFHFDCYRLEGARDAFDINFDDVFSTAPTADARDRRRIVLIEWGERVPGLIPSGHDVREIFLYHATPTARRFVFANFSAAERAELRAIANAPPPTTTPTDTTDYHPAPTQNHAVDPAVLFHLAFPVNDLDAARRFYGGLLGCREGRSSATWVDFDFFGHQIVAHLLPELAARNATNPVDGKAVPVPHFGAILTPAHWRTVANALTAANVPFAVPPYTRFAGHPGEQSTFVVFDPAGNALEFKAFSDRSQVFATGPGIDDTADGTADDTAGR